MYQISSAAIYNIYIHTCMYNIPWFPMNLAVMLPLPGGLVLLLRPKEKDLRKCRWRDVIPGYWGLGQGGQACKKTCCSTGNLLRNFGSFWGPCRHLVGSNRESCYVLLIQLFVGFTVTPLVWNRIFPIFPHISTSFPKFFFRFPDDLLAVDWSLTQADDLKGTAGDWDIWPYLQASQAKPSR